MDGVPFGSGRCLYAVKSPVVLGHGFACAFVRRCSRPDCRATVYQELGVSQFWAWIWCFTVLLSVFFLAVFWTRRPPWQCSAIRLWIQARLHPFNTTTPNNQHEKPRKNNGDVALRCPVAAEGEHALNKYGSSPIDVMVKTVTSSRRLHWADARLDQCYKRLFA
jgi:hypothetical protein